MSADGSEWIGLRLLQITNRHLHPALDGRAIQQALVNLLDNAIKHSPSGTSVQVGLGIDGVAASRESAAVLPCGEPGPVKSPAQEVSGGFPTAATVRLWVEDLGDGIPPEEQEKIFEPFYRRGAELRRETQGIGIGLTIVKHVVEAHGGRVRVRSAVGEGSRFTIELPANQIPMTKLQ